ncbi:TetR/AcrR family transcriptional regulator [Asanoa sp. NPDC049518]|uniref:TetR/AcrR family transcriptional regulator n=1 Tax=unclassified Asanoa TaxID=2685164 RepID=UPI003435A155
MSDAQPIWTRPERGRRGPAPGHTRNEIVAAAIALADAEGLSAVSMRAVATALDTTAGSLYRYLSSRDDLLDLMTDHAVGELRPYPQRQGDWLDQLQALAQRQLDLHRRHRWLGELIQRPTSAGPETLDWYDHCLGVLSDVPAPTTAKFEAIALMTGVVVLFSRTQTSTAQPFAALDPARHPHLAAALANPGQPPQDDLFGRALRALLTGLLGERRQEPVAEGVHAPDRAVSHRGQAG